jgi:hypothetical protein
MKVIIEGGLYAIFQKPEYKDKATGEVIEGKTILQLMIQNELRNGQVKNELHDISIPVERVKEYADKKGETVQVVCNLFVKGELTLYGV